MERDSPSQRKAQLDKAEREHLEDVVTEMRDRVEDNVRFQLTQQGLDTKPEDTGSLDEETSSLVEAIELEAVDGDDWNDGFEQYITGVGYTIVNRLAALRCMEVRDFVDEEVTVFKQNGLTPAAETLVNEEFLLEDEAILEAYHRECDVLAEEIEILFDRSSALSLIDPDDDTYEELCGMLDSVPDEVWRADDVLGWVYEYYNVKLLDDLRRKGDREGLDPEDVPPANQFYTPHWVVRMLTDNSLGKLYLEHTGELQDVVEAQEDFSPNERKNRPLSPDESPDIADFCTYLVPSDEAGEPTDFDHPKELRVIDPACGSGHFLLYAFDVLERIWRAETGLAEEKIPKQILKHNLHGVDLDMRACQLSAFNLYLKGRTRAEAEGVESFDMPEVGIVCADATIAEIDGVEAVFDEVAGDDEEVEQALRRILDAFEEVNGLGSLLDVRGTIGDLFEDDSDTEGVQITLDDDPTADHTLGQVLHSLSEAIEEHRDSDSFLAQDLRSFVRLLDILAQDYDVALMNPPYGTRNRMPDSVQKYIESTYEYPAEFYINFLEVGERISKEYGRIGMLVPRTFMFKHRFEEFRTDMVEGAASFDYLAEFGMGILDNATVNTAATVIRSDEQKQTMGTFLRLYDVPKGEKEQTFLNELSGISQDINRTFNVKLSEFEEIPGNSICYSTPKEVRDLHVTNVKLDCEQAGIDGESVGEAKQGIATADNNRFLRQYWEVSDFDTFSPIARGGADAWILPQVAEVVKWNQSGTEIKRFSDTIRTPNEHLYGRDGLTWTRIKKTGRRFGYFPPDGYFSDNGYLFVPFDDDTSLWTLMSVLNSDLYHALFLSITTGRHWNAGEVGSIPWYPQLEENKTLEQLSKSQYHIKTRENASSPTSPYYVAPELYPREAVDDFWYDHPHVSGMDLPEGIGSETNEAPLRTLCKRALQANAERQSELEATFDAVNEAVYEELDISSKTQDELIEEVTLRTLVDLDDRHVSATVRSEDVDAEIKSYVTNLVHHFGMEAVRQEADGIIPLHGTDDRANMFDRVIERFKDAYGEYAEDRLIEVDEILGGKSATDEAYPNLRTFIENDLFDYHVDRMEYTPILWKITTERLIADSTGEGFACFVDYHSLDSGLLDRLANQYIEPRKAELRERRSAANRRRSDESLSTSEQAKAAEQYDRCVSGLNQINVFEDIIQDLGSITEREFDDEGRRLLKDLAPKVAAFRESTRNRIDTLVELRNQNTEEWFQDTFSNNFWNAVDEWREEWIDALEELEYACEEYAKPVDEPVEAHLADLFDYFNWRLKGSDHYSSSGILFMTYYFKREGGDLLDEDGRPFETLTEDERRLASLATGLDDSSIVDKEFLEAIADDEGVKDVEDLPPLAEFKALAEEIDDRCQAIDRKIPSAWSERALSEITTEGYNPNLKHGVEINIKPLAEAEIVPKTVDDDVL